MDTREVSSPNIEKRVETLERSHAEIFESQKKLQESQESLHKSQQETFSMVQGLTTNLQGWDVKHGATEKAIYKLSINVENMQGNFINLKKEQAESQDKFQVEQKSSQDKFQASIEKQLKAMAKRDWATLLTLFIIVCGGGVAFVDYRFDPVIRDGIAKDSTDRRQYNLFNQNTEKLNALNTEVATARAIVGESKERINKLDNDNTVLREKIIRLEIEKEKK